jgi:hypothetical protein
LQGPEEERTLTQLRADVFRDLLLDDDPEILAALAALETAADDAETPDTETADTDTAVLETAVAELDVADLDGVRDGASESDMTPKGLGARARYRGIAPTVFVTVPALTLVGRSDEPAVLEGYGPIDIDTARELAGRAVGMESDPDPRRFRRQHRPVAVDLTDGASLRHRTEHDDAASFNRAGPKCGSSGIAKLRCSAGVATRSRSSATWRLGTG